VQIIWNLNIGPPEKADIEKYLNPYLALIPKWCQEFYIDLVSSNENEDVVATMNCSYQYRRLTLTLYSAKWFTLPEHERENTMVHELIHGILLPVFTYAYETIGTLASDEVQELTQRELDGRNEAVTQDMAYCIYNLRRV
jgi:hypothetical protein